MPRIMRSAHTVLGEVSRSPSSRATLTGAQRAEEPPQFLLELPDLEEVAVQRVFSE
jgi:hypothetical protein